MTHLIIIGAQKAGTTTLFDCLAPHPDIATADKKEVNFFGFQFERGVDWYMSLFGPVGGVKLDASPQYLHMSSVAHQIEQVLPDARLVCLIRDPISRALSNYRFNLARGLQDPSESFCESINTTRGEEIYLHKGLYAQQLSRFDSFHDAGRLLLIDFAALIADQREVADRICRFAGLHGIPADIAISKASNQTAPVSQSAAKLIYRATQLRAAHQEMYDGLPTWIKNSLSSMKSKVKKFSKGEVLKNSPLSRESEAELIQFFRSDIKVLRQKFNFEASWQSQYLN